ncbi:MAG: TonB family protein [Terriglobales bacterium]
MIRDWKQWEGQIVNGTFPLRQYLGGSEHSAVFLTERRVRGESQRAAIKLIAADPATAEIQLSRWETAAKLSHPHLLGLFETGSCQLDKVVLLYVLMEYAEDNLAQVLPHRALTPEEVRDLLGPALDALTYIHGKSLVHSRLKPSNVMAAQDQLKLSSDSLLRSGDAAGRTGPPSVYDAPEMASGNILPASDTWSLGMTLMEVLTQRLPACEGIAEPLPETVPAPFMGIAHCCLRRDPQRRCTVADIATRLQSTASASPRPSTVRIPAASAKWRFILPIAALAVVAAALLLGPKLLNRRPDAQRAASVSPEAAASPAPASTLPKPESTPAPAAKPSAIKSSTIKPSATKPRDEEQNSESSSSLSPLAPAATSPAGGSDQGRILQRVMPAVSQSALKTITGTIRIRVKVAVDASGNVEKATFISAGPSRYFAGKAMQAAQQWKFAPAEVNGQAVPSAWVLRFSVRRSGTEMDSEPTKP